MLPVILAGGIMLGIFFGDYISRNRLSPQEEKLRTMLSLIKSQYVDDIDVDSLLEVTFPELIAQLDPHSAYIPASALTQVNDELESSFGGVGVSFQVLNDTVHVIEVVAGGPAEEAGILPGDKILAADTVNLSVKGVTTEKIFSTLRGKEGTKVKLKIKRNTSRKPLEIEVTRGEIPSASVDASYMLTKNIGYVRVSKFARNTYEEFYNALSSLKKKGAEKFVIDLRNNSGGYMDQAIYMANEFLPADKMIVYTKGRRPENETMAISDGNGNFLDNEVVVLMNEYSASASEIFAGAIQDNDRGLIIGRRSFGKGLVQNQSEFADSSAVRLTVARYYTPTGRSIQKEYTRGKDGRYELDILERYNHGEFYSSDSIKLDKSKMFTTPAGRTVYGGGGIMPDVFVPEDTLGVTGYYIEAVNKGLIQDYANRTAEKLRPLMGDNKTLEQMERIIPRDNTLLTGFVDFAAANGLPARWYYINQSRDLLINQIKGVLARDLVGYEAFITVINRRDGTIDKAVRDLQENKSPVQLKK